MAQLPPLTGDPAYPAAPTPGPERPRYRPPIGIPVSRQRRLGSALLAIAFHVIVIMLLIVPFTSPELMREILGAGGPGPAGGGGGGSRGTGGAKTERIQFVRVAPAPTPVPPVIPPLVKPPVVPPVVPPPVVPPPPVPQPKPAETAVAPPAAAEVKSGTTGTGGGSGNDGSAGSGPGSGGGVGSGVGTGKGSSVGPGTGGGPGTIYPPSPTELFLPPLPVPNKAKGTVVVIFDVDSTGKVLDLQFTQTRDGNYNRKLREAFSSIRFRPAVNSSGVPVRAKAELTYSL